MNTLCSLDTSLDLEAEGGWNIEKISGADIAAEWEYKSELSTYPS